MAFCDACGRNSSFAVVNRTRTVNIRGMDIHIPYRTEVCIACGEERYSEELEMLILDKAASIYRDKQRMLPSEQIARYMGSAREVVSRMLKYFAGEGIVQVSRKGVKVLDKGRLRKLAL